MNRGDADLSHNFYAGAYLDRRAEERTDEQWLATALADPATRVIAARGSAQLIARDPPGLALLDLEHPLVRGASVERFMLLGWFRGTRCLLLLLDDDAPDEVDVNASFEDLRPLANVLPTQEAALLAYARALGVWRAGHRYCGACGTATVAIQAGHALRCPTCARETYPRIDPAIIVLVSDGERALLGRKAAWPAGRYSTIAGFVEPGEALEDAVRREVQEETGIGLARIAYHSSQPWPFPAALMLGFLALATQPAATLTHDGELEDAHWFSRQSVAAGEILLPPTTSISRRLIEHWLHGWP